MEARINFFILISLAGLISLGFAQEAATSPATAEKPVEVTVPSFPYVAEITGNDVYIRSGPGRNYYQCGRLNKADKVTVVEVQSGWSRIVPPAGSFSWISTQYVRVDPDNPGTGIVEGNAVRVYVGSDDMDLMRSITKLKLNRGDKVSLLGERKSGYYKIAPPTGDYRWVSTKYTKPLIKPPITPPPVVPAAPDTGPVVPTDISVEARRLKEYYALQKQMEAERVKPIAQQNYANIKKSLLAIAGDRQAGKATRYSQFALKRVERFELALEVSQAVRLQDAELKRIKADIAKAGAKRLAELKNLGRFAVIGRLQAFRTYGPGHYRIIGDAGKTICHAVPASKGDLRKFIGRKVGLVGTIEPQLEPPWVLVRFTEVVELK